MTVKNILPSEKTRLMQEFAENVASIGAELGPIVDECLATYPSERVKVMFGRIPSLLHICIHAPRMLDERLRVVANGVAPNVLERAEKHLKGEAKRITELYAETLTNNRIDDTGQVQHEAAAKALKQSAVNAKKHGQQHIAVEAALGLMSAWFHSIALPLEVLNIARQFLPSLKNNQMKKGIEGLAQQLNAMDELEEQLVNLCLFLFLVPEESDLKAGISVNETMARERLDAAL